MTLVSVACGQLVIPGHLRDRVNTLSGVPLFFRLLHKNGHLHQRTSQRSAVGSKTVLVLLDQSPRLHPKLPTTLTGQLSWFGPCGCLSFRFPLAPCWSLVRGRGVCVAGHQMV